ncbi:hypothetical protein C8R43DRAFT_1142899 [Mycena crocata]|nr:hypothetical protein C8R43DRAFT_1142899 [Mycena crocata]
MSTILDPDTRIALALSASRAAFYVLEAQAQRSQNPYPYQWLWDRQAARDALGQYARLRLAKIQRANLRRYQRLRYLQTVAHPRASPPWSDPDDSDWGPPAWPDSQWKDHDPAGLDGFSARLNFVFACKIGTEDDVEAFGGTEEEDLPFEEEEPFCFEEEEDSVILRTGVPGFPEVAADVVLKDETLVGDQDEKVDEEGEEGERLVGVDSDDEITMGLEGGDGEGDPGGDGGASKDVPYFDSLWPRLGLLPLSATEAIHLLPSNKPVYRQRKSIPHFDPDNLLLREYGPDAADGHNIEEELLAVSVYFSILVPTTWAESWDAMVVHDDGEECDGDYGNPDTQMQLQALHSLQIIRMVPYFHKTSHQGISPAFLFLTDGEAIERPFKPILRVCLQRGEIIDWSFFQFLPVTSAKDDIEDEDDDDEIPGLDPADGTTPCCSCFRVCSGQCGGLKSKL